MSQKSYDFVNDAETVKSFGFRTIWFLKETFHPKIQSLKIFSEIEMTHFFVFGLSSVWHLQYVCTDGIGIELHVVDSKL
jgi:hypothetical protein